MRGQTTVRYQPRLHIGRDKLCTLSRHDNITRQRKAEAGTSRPAFNRSYDRHGTAAHGADDIVQTVDPCGALIQRHALAFDELVQITSGAEKRALGGQDDGPDAPVLCHLAGFHDAIIQLGRQRPAFIRIAVPDDQAVACVLQPCTHVSLPFSPVFLVGRA